MGELWSLHTYPVTDSVGRAAAAVTGSNTALWIHGDHRVNAVAINIKDLVDAATNVGGRQEEKRREEMRRATCINNTNANSPATQQPNVLYLLGFHFVTVVPERGRKSEGDKRSS